MFMCHVYEFLTYDLYILIFIYSPCYIAIVVLEAFTHLNQMLNISKHLYNCIKLTIQSRKHMYYCMINLTTQHFHEKKDL